jgi:NADH:ubiquinone oxidoreductase subunit K
VNVVCLQYVLDMRMLCVFSMCSMWEGSILRRVHTWMEVLFSLLHSVCVPSSCHLFLSLSRCHPFLSYCIVLISTSIHLGRCDTCTLVCLCLCLCACCLAVAFAISLVVLFWRQSSYEIERRGQSLEEMKRITS